MGGKYHLGLFREIWGGGHGQPGPYGSYAYDRDTQVEWKCYIILAVEAMHGMAVVVNDQAKGTGGWSHLYIIFIEPSLKHKRL